MFTLIGYAVVGYVALSIIVPISIVVLYLGYAFLHIALHRSAR